MVAAGRYNLMLTPHRPQQQQELHLFFSSGPRFPATIYYELYLRTYVQLFMDMPSNYGMDTMVSEEINRTAFTHLKNIYRDVRDDEH